MLCIDLLNGPLPTSVVLPTSAILTLEVSRGVVSRLANACFSASIWLRPPLSIAFPVLPTTSPVVLVVLGSPNRIKRFAPDSKSLAASGCFDLKF